MVLDYCLYQIVWMDMSCLLVSNQVKKVYVVVCGDYGPWSSEMLTRIVSLLDG